MNLKELNSEFSILFEDLASAGSKGLDSYERSICFTYAQDEIIKTLAKQGKLDDIQELVAFNENTVALQAVYKTAKKYARVPKTLLELDHFLSGADKDIPAVSVPQVVIDSMLSAAYKYPPVNLAYVVVGEDALIVFPPLYFVTRAFVTRYVKLPTPVILETLTGADTIRDETAATEPILKDGYQVELVNAAVQFAVKVYIGQQEKEAGNDSSRNKQ